MKVQDPADNYIQYMSKYGYLEVQRKAKAKWEQRIIVVVVVVLVVAIFGFEWHPHNQRKCFSPYCSDLSVRCLVQIVAWVNFRWLVLFSVLFIIHMTIDSSTSNNINLNIYNLTYNLKGHLE